MGDGDMPLHEKLTSLESYFPDENGLEILIINLKENISNTSSNAAKFIQRNSAKDKPNNNLVAPTVSINLNLTSRAGDAAMASSA